MKRDILRFLRESGDGFVSGQMICEHFGVSRQAVWKNVAQLKEMGYCIESVSNRGYRLVKEPDILYAPDLESRFKDGGFFKKVLCYDEVDSTNTLVKRLAEEGEDEGVMVLAEHQTAGKGRRGRSWSSEKDAGIFMSFLLRPSLEPMHISGLTLVAALALTAALKDVYRSEPKIKWPNDVVLGNKKICGILTEMSSELNVINYAVAGIGINVNNDRFPKEIAETATSLLIETGERKNRAEIVAAFAEWFPIYYNKYLKTGDLSELKDEYNSRLANKGKQVQIFHGMIEECTSDKMETGIAVGIDNDGALIVDTDKGRKSVVSGEVSVRGLYGYV